MQAQSDLISSTLEVYSLENSTRTVIYSEEGHFEAPNWSPDGQSLIINQGGSLYSVNIKDASKEKINTGTLSHLNNDHGVSMDGNWYALSNNDPIPGVESGTSRIYVMAYGGSNPELITEKYPSARSPFYHC